MGESYIRIGDNFKLQSGFAFPSSAFVDGGIPIVRMSDLKNGWLKFENTKYVRQSWLIASTVFSLKEDDFLLGMSGSLSNHAVVRKGDVPALLNQRVGRLQRKNSTQNYEYICYWLKSNFYERYAEVQGEGAAQKNISSKQIEAFKYRCVSLDTQKKIAQILQTIDQTIEKTEALIEKYQQIKAGLMHDLFTRGIGTDGKLRPPREQAPELYQQTPIGWIPKEWSIKSIGQLFSIQLGKMLSRAAKSGKPEFSYLGNKNVQLDFVNLDDLETMEFSPREREKYKLTAGDLLVCEGGDVGRTAMWRREYDNCYYQKAIHRLRPISGELMPELMLRFMRYAKDTGMLINFTSQTSIAHLTREKLAGVKVLVPEPSEQIRLVEKFDSIDKSILSEKDLLGKFVKQKSGLMHDLLTGKVQVNLDSPDAIHA